MIHEHVKHGAWRAERPPQLQGPAGQAWQIVAAPREPAQAATVAAWLLFAPPAHPFWPYYVLSVVHLRAIPGVKTAHRRHDDMTHELMVMALNPEHAPPDPVGWGAMHYLSPIDVVEQFQVPDDAAAARLLELAVRACCDGRLSPDQDYRAVWRRMVATTAEHARGEHAHG